MKLGFIQARHPIDRADMTALSYGYLRAATEGIDVEWQFFNSADEVTECDLLGVSSASQDIEDASKIAIFVKSRYPQTTVVLGGLHITSFPDLLPQSFDVGVIGEGDQTIKELVAWKKGQTTLGSINGIVFRHTDQVVRTSPRNPLVLDSLPYPYRKPGDQPYFLTSRGCPFRCAFCGSSVIWGKPRYFSAQYLVSEIEEVLRQSPSTSMIALWDELFISNRQRLEEFVLLVERGLAKRVKFSLNVRANLVTDELCDLLKRMNTFQVYFGAESGSDKVLAYLNKGLTADINQRAVDTLNKHGLFVGLSMIIGCPGETETDVRSSYDFVVRNSEAGKVSSIATGFNILSPMPHTKVWSDAVNKGLITDDFEWHRLAVWAWYRSMRVKSLEEWINIRRRNSSIYMGDMLAEERLFELMLEYENKLEILRQQDPWF